MAAGEYRKMKEVVVESLSTTSFHEEPPEITKLPTPKKQQFSQIKRKRPPAMPKKHYLNFKGVTHNARIPVKKDTNLDINLIMTESDEYMICKTDRLTSIYTSRKGDQSSQPE